MDRGLRTRLGSSRHGVARRRVPAPDHAGRAISHPVSSIDLDRAVETFAAATDFTVGLEEEFGILDADTLELIGAFEELRDAAAEIDPLLHQHITGELISSEIEIISGRGADLQDAQRRQRERRRALFALAAAHGFELGATGTHPWSDYRRQAVIDTPHYHRVEDGLKYVAWRNNTFSLHVHVGVRDIDRAVRVCDRMRPVLPLLLAVSANSPFIDGRLAGLHSARSQTFTRSFPRCGVPYAFGGWAAFRDYIALLIRTNSIIEFTQIWWSVRPHFSYGTVEVRICDAQSTAGEADALSALVVACVAQATLEVDAGAGGPEIPGFLIEENMWRAIRHGLDGSMIDFERGAEYPSSEIVERLLAWTAPARAALAIDVEPALGAPNGAQRQRAMIEAGATMHETYESIVRDTRATYSEEVRA
jgi:glutamate---cysteine ligase / carboxylate-amine ligase